VKRDGQPVMEFFVQFSVLLHFILVNIKHESYNKFF